MDQILGSALQAQGVDAEGADFAFVTYGTDENAVALNAFRIPGIPTGSMEQLARLMSGAGTDVDAESVTIGGKTVLKISGGQTGGAVYFYVADDTAFTAAGQDESLIEQLLRSSPDRHGRADRDLPERGGGHRTHRSGQGDGRARPEGARRRPARHRDS